MMTITRQSIVLIWLALMSGGCQQNLDRPILLVLPNDYRGEFRIVKDQQGIPFSKSANAYCFTIPSSGELRSPDITPFFRWHKIRVEYADGRVIVDYTKDIFSGHGLQIVDHGVTSSASTEHDGTVLRWCVVELQ